MRIKLIILILLFGITCGCRNSTSPGRGTENVQLPDTGKAILSFNEMEHDFGKISEGEKVGFIFTFENKGTSDLVITKASTSCGCTVPKYDTHPIQPGGKGSMEVVFNSSGYNGIQAKTITVHSNASIPVLILKITADVNNSN